MINVNSWSGWGRKVFIIIRFGNWLTWLPHNLTLLIGWLSHNLLIKNWFPLRWNTVFLRRQLRPFGINHIRVYFLIFVKKREGMQFWQHLFVLFFQFLKVLKVCILVNTVSGLYRGSVHIGWVSVIIHFNLFFLTKKGLICILLKNRL